MPRRVRALPQGARIRERKNEKSKIRGWGGICAPRAQHGREPSFGKIRSIGGKNNVKL